MSSISLEKSSQLKVVAILMMLCLHLFNNDYTGVYDPLLFIGGKPIIYYISLFSDACVPIFAFVSGYGLYYKFKKDSSLYFKSNIIRIKKLYINYWIILVIFVLIVGMLIGKIGYPGSFLKFVLNFFTFSDSYNRTWWFLAIYTLFVFTSGFWFILLDKISPIFYLSILLALYLIAFVLRIYVVISFGNSLLDGFYEIFLLYFYCLFQFMLGAFAFKYDWNTFISTKLSNVRNKSLIGYFGIVTLIVVHAIIPNLIIAPFNALVFIIIFLNIDLPQSLKRFINFFVPNCTNLWLIHMFFFAIYLPNFIYAFKYPILIYAVLISLCLISSYVVNYLNKRVAIVLEESGIIIKLKEFCAKV